MKSSDVIQKLKDELPHVAGLMMRIEIGRFHDAGSKFAHCNFSVLAGKITLVMVPTLTPAQASYLKRACVKAIRAAGDTKKIMVYRVNSKETYV